MPASGDSAGLNKGATSGSGDQNQPVDRPTPAAQALIHAHCSAPSPRRRGSGHLRLGRLPASPAATCLVVVRAPQSGCRAPRLRFGVQTRNGRRRRRPCPRVRLPRRCGSFFSWTSPSKTSCASPPDRHRLTSGSERRHRPGPCSPAPASLLPRLRQPVAAPGASAPTPRHFPAAVRPAAAPPCSDRARSSLGMRIQKKTS